jgi:hypothetical protein
MCLLWWSKFENILFNFSGYFSKKVRNYVYTSGIKYHLLLMITEGNDTFSSLDIEITSVVHDVQTILQKTQHYSACIWCSSMLF